MKTLHLLLLAVLSLVSCETATDPVTHKRSHTYVGPNITGSLGYQGASMSLTLWGKEKPASLEVPEAVLGVPINTK